MRTENSKIIFFDIDGTLIGMNGIISPQLKGALAKAQENGHKICIATGRSLDDKVKELKELNWDGYVLSNGAYGEYNGDTVICEYISDQDVKEFIEYSQAMPDVGIIIEGGNGSFTTASSAEIAFEFLSKATNGKLTREMLNEYFEIAEDLTKIGKINKIMYFNGERYAEDFIARFGDKMDFSPNSITRSREWDTAEITKKGITKAVGIESVIKYAGYERKDVIAVGDGYNDIEMIEYADIGVAMGNGVEQLKEKADVVTDAQANDGVVKMLAMLKLTD